MTTHNLKISGKPLAPERQVLLDAIQQINIHGWWQGRAIPGGGRCVMLAILHAAHHPLAFAAQCLFRKHMGFESYDDATKWNDAPDRTKEDVIQALESAALS